MLKIIHLKEGLRMYRRARNIKKHGFKQPKGNYKTIIKNGIENCWDKDHFNASSGHFNEFWTRDFAFSAESLIKLGYKKKVKKTLEYALDTFSRYGKITTTISPERIPFDFPYYAVDSLPCLLRTLALVKDKKLTERYHFILNKETIRFFNTAIQPSSGLIKKDRYFSSIKDHSRRLSSCYDNCMASMLDDSLKKLKLENPFARYRYPRMIEEVFWNGEYFYDDINQNKIITGDSNIFPFWCNVFDDKRMLKTAISSIQSASLDKPLSLKYSSKRHKENKMIFVEKFAKDYEHDSIWTNLAPIYINLVKKVDRKKAKQYLDQYKKIIETYGCIELLNNNLKPYSTFYYHADRDMLWYSNLLTL